MKIIFHRPRTMTELSFTIWVGFRSITIALYNYKLHITTSWAWQNMYFSNPKKWKNIFDYNMERFK